MKKPPHVLLVFSAEGDWEALYIDGVKRLEGHRVRTEDILNVLGIKVDFFTHPELDDPDDANPLEMFPDRWPVKP